ncbi:MAG: hypothetical protein AAF620_07720 [Bacteroidota bacterium]
MIFDSSNLGNDVVFSFEINYPRESFAKLDFWFKSRLSAFQKRSLLVVNGAFEILSNKRVGLKGGFFKGFSYSTCYLISMNNTLIFGLTLLREEYSIFTALVDIVVHLLFIYFNYLIFKTFW